MGFWSNIYFCRSSHPRGNFPSLMYNYSLPLTVNISVALCTYTAPLFMYIVSTIGMEGEIQFVCFIVSNNKHIKCSLLLIEGRRIQFDTYLYKNLLIIFTIVLNISQIYPPVYSNLVFAKAYMYHKIYS